MSFSSSSTNWYVLQVFLPKPVQLTAARGFPSRRGRIHRRIQPARRQRWPSHQVLAREGCACIGLAHSLPGAANLCKGWMKNEEERRDRESMTFKQGQKFRGRFADVEIWESGTHCLYSTAKRTRVPCYRQQMHITSRTACKYSLPLILSLVHEQGNEQRSKVGQLESRDDGTKRARASKIFHVARQRRTLLLTILPKGRSRNAL